MEKKKDYLELNCQNFTERGFNLIINCGAVKYYGRIHEVKCSPNVSQFPKGFILSGLQHWCNGVPNTLTEEKGTEQLLLHCNPTASWTLTIRGVSTWTIDFGVYGRERVLKFLSDHGIAMDNEVIEV